jgi:predicted DsbA family dithiol-disulfide isomerase
MTRPVVEVFADVLCPFAHVGLRRFRGRRAELGLSQPTLRVRAWPLELVNGVPLDVESVGRHVHELREQVEANLFRGFRPAAFPATSLPALGLAARAYRHGDWIGEHVSLALRDALFEEGQDISDPAVLENIASRFHLTLSDRDSEDAVLVDWEEGKRRGVRGSPEFIVDDRAYFCPALRIEHTDGNVRIVPNPEAFDAFLDDCFAGNDTRAIARQASR